MVTLNSWLKVFVLISGAVFLFLFSSSPQTHCQACELEYGGHTYDGYEAYEFFEAGCISYNRPEDYVYIDIDDLNYSKDSNGRINITLA